MKSNDGEILRTLDGSRSGGARKRAAVRVEDLLPLLRLAPMRATPVSAAPTQAEHNALVKDVERIHQRLQEIALLLQAKVKP